MSWLNESSIIVLVVVLSRLFESWSMTSVMLRLLQFAVLVCDGGVRGDAGHGAEDAAEQAAALVGDRGRRAARVAEGAVVLEVARRRVGERDRGNGQHAGRNGGHDDSSLLQHSCSPDESPE